MWRPECIAHLPPTASLKPTESHIWQRVAAGVFRLCEVSAQITTIGRYVSREDSEEVRDNKKEGERRGYHIR